jgi:hypothetical protein
MAGLAHAADCLERLGRRLIRKPVAKYDHDADDAVSDEVAEFNRTGEIEAIIR